VGASGANGAWQALGLQGKGFGVWVASGDKPREALLGWGPDAELRHAAVARTWARQHSRRRPFFVSFSCFYATIFPDFAT
jgi:hypothetical protein